jgi:NADH-quinone oxidoreductase subunit N
MITLDANWFSIAPESILAGTGVVVLIVSTLRTRARHMVSAWLSVASALVAGGWLVAQWYDPASSSFSGAISPDRFAAVAGAIVLMAHVVGVFLGMGGLGHIGRQRAEYYGLLLLSTSGMIVLTKGTDLVTLLLGLEVMSLPLYVLAGFRRDSSKGIEGALKYFLMGAFASAVLVFGIALLYGSTGSTSLSDVAFAAYSFDLYSSPLFVAGVGLVLVGFLFKLAAVPFHAWAPDAYTGAPAVSVAFMATGPKVAAVAVVLRVLLDVGGDWMQVLWVLAALSMTFGNVVAVMQQDVKRMLAYSSIAHGGYVLVGLTAATTEAAGAAVFYLGVYALMNAGAFAVVALASGKNEQDTSLGAMTGLGYRRPLIGLAMAVMMFSLAGIPPTAGFPAKLFVFAAAVDRGLIFLVVIAVLNSVIGAFYYLRVVVRMYMTSSTGNEPTVHRSTAIGFALALIVVAILAVGVLPGWFVDVARTAAAAPIP